MDNARKKIPVYQLDDLDAKEAGVYLFKSGNIHVENMPTVAVPHRHDHYCCFLLESGSVEFNIDFKPVQLAEGSLLVSYPGQIHQYVADKKCKGSVLFFDAKLVDESARMIIEESLTSVALLSLGAKDQEWFNSLFDLIGGAIGPGKDATFQAQLTRSLLDAFIYRASALYQQQESTRAREHSSRHIDITKKFRRLLQENFRTMKKPSAYADKMNFSVSYLNDTVKAVTGFPITYFIQQEVISEAQRLLYYSDMSIKEIAYHLGYEDDKYFIRLFGKTTGISPAAFRKSRPSKAVQKA